MKPVFIYFREVPFNGNNKFVLDFSDEEFVQRVYFSKKTDYYIASLDCNLILKEYIKKDKEKMIEELSARSRLLLQKGTAYQNDIGWLTSATAGYYNFPGFGVTYNFITYPKIIDEYSYKYKFYDTKMKRITDCKIYSPFSHFKGNGFEFKRIMGPKKNDTVTVSLFDDNKKIKTVFIHNFKEINYFTNIIYRDRNNLFIKDSLTSEWLVQVKIYFSKQQIMRLKQKRHLTLAIFFEIFMKFKKRALDM